ncbi:MAG: hypothetical protein JW832_15080 [Deltaproteobacteria bacterium]|nr:hypothetical protein [Deltaproteobacteria bacterium]
MNRLNEEYKKGFELGLNATDERENVLDLDMLNMFRTDEEIQSSQSENLLDTLNMFRTDEERKARQRGYAAGVKERDLRKRGIR